MILAMKNLISPEEVVELIRQRLRAETQRALAASLGVSQAYLSEVLNGSLIASPRLAEALGLERLILYRRKDPTAA